MKKMSNDPTQKNAPKEKWKFHVHPLIKLSLYLVFNIIIFFPSFKGLRIYFLGLEILLSVYVRLNFRYFLGFFKFLALNFIGFYFIFYFIEKSWLRALIIFGDYGLSILTFSLASFIFIHTCPTHEILLSLRILKIPEKICFAIAITTQFIPILSIKIHEVLIFQKSRGYKFSIFRLGPIIIPVVLYVIDLSIKYSMSLKSRGFEL